MPPKKSGTLGNAGSGVMGTVRAALNAIKDLGEKALDKNSTTSAKIFVLSIVVMIVVLVLAAFLASVKQPVWAGVLCCVAIAVQVLTIVMLGFFLSENLPAPIKKWGRTVPIYDQFPRKDREQLAKQLEAIRERSLAFLQKHYPDLKDDDVRAAIFLPKFDPVEKAVGCVLYIPDELRQNLNSPDERHIQLFAGEGVSGDVFLNGQERVVVSRDYGLIDAAKLETIHKDLKWIVGLPLKGEETMGTLNVDGLVTSCDKEILAKMTKDIESNVAQVADSLAKLPQARINIRVDQVTPKNC